MEKTPEFPHKEPTMDIEAVARAKAQNEAEIKRLLDDFKGEVKKLKSLESNEYLDLVNPEKLTEEDMIFFRRFKRAEISIDDIDKQLQTFGSSPNSPLKEIYQNSINFLKYIRSQLATSHFDRR